MAAEMIPFEEYSFTIRPILNSDLEVSRIQLIPVENSSIEYITTDTMLNVTPQIGKLEIIRDIITIIDEHDERITVPAAIIDTISDFEYLSYNSHKGVQVEVDEVDLNGNPTGTTHKVLFSIMNQNTTEKIPNEIKINKITWRGNPTTTQHVALSVYHLEEGSWVCVSEQKDFEVSSDGMLNNPIIISSVEEDTKYKIVAYHYETEEQHEFYFYAPIKPVCGENPIVDKIEWEGRKLYISCPNIKQEIEGDLPLADWGFPMDYQTKGLNLRSSIVSSDADNYNFKCLVDGSNKAIPCIASYPNRIYNFPDNQDFDNIFANDILAPTSGNFRIIAFNFLIKSMNVGDKCEFLKYKDINNVDRFIGIERSNANSNYYLSIGGNNALWSLCTNNDLLNKWNTLFLCFLNKNGTNYCRVLIPNLVNPFAEGLKKGDNLQYVPKENSQYFNVDRRDFDVTIDFVANSTNIIKAYLLVYLYQYDDSPTYGSLKEIQLPLDGSSTITTSVPNDFAYAARFGFKIVVNDDLQQNIILIDDIKINNNTVTLIDSDYTTEYSDVRLANYIIFNWSRIETRQISVLTSVLNGYSGNFNVSSEITASNTTMYFGGGGGAGGKYATLNFRYSHNHLCSGTTSSNDSSATENRPMNYTIRIWKRIA